MSHYSTGSGIEANSSTPGQGVVDRPAGRRATDDVERLGPLLSEYGIEMTGPPLDDGGPEEPA